MDAPAPLDQECRRVVACLIEKEATTPDQYPMTLNGVRLACNQASNREPVVDYSEAAVEQALRRLADQGLAKMVHRPGDRVVKYRHSLDAALEVNGGPLAVLAVLMLRGAQTPGELRQRTARYGAIESLVDVDAALTALLERDPPLVERLGRRPGQKEVRYRHLLGGDAGPVPEDDEMLLPEVDAGSAPSVADLMADIEVLRARVDLLFAELGVEDVSSQSPTDADEA